MMSHEESSEFRWNFFKVPGSNCGYGSRIQNECGFVLIRIRNTYNTYSK